MWLSLQSEPTAGWDPCHRGHGTTGLKPKLRAGRGTGKRQFANPSSGGGKDRVANCGSKRRHSGLTHPGGWRVAIYYINVGFIRSFVHPSYGIAVEIRLFDGSILRRNFATANDAGPKYGRALELSPRSFGIHHQTCVYRCVHGRNFHFALIVDFHLGHRGDVGQETSMDGNAHTGALTRLTFSPARFLSSHFNHSPHAGSVQGIVLRRTIVICVLWRGSFDIDDSRGTDQFEQ